MTTTLFLLSFWILYEASEPFAHGLEHSLYLSKTGYFEGDGDIAWKLLRFDFLLLVVPYFDRFTYEPPISVTFSLLDDQHLLTILPS